MACLQAPGASLRTRSTAVTSGCSGSRRTRTLVSACGQCVVRQGDARLRCHANARLNKGASMLYQTAAITLPPAAPAPGGRADSRGSASAATWGPTARQAGCASQGKVGSPHLAAVHASLLGHPTQHGHTHQLVQLTPPHRFSAAETASWCPHLTSISWSFPSSRLMYSSGLGPEHRRSASHCCLAAQSQPQVRIGSV